MSIFAAPPSIGPERTTDSGTFRERGSYLRSGLATVAGAFHELAGQNICNPSWRYTRTAYTCMSGLKRLTSETRTWYEP